MAAVMTPSEALMWAVERDPILRSTFLNITVLDRPPDIDRLVRRIADTIDAFPRMRQRVRSPSIPLPWDRPRWIEDASFDLNYHVRHVALPPPGTQRDLLDLSALLLEDAFDPVRPLWQLTVVEGIRDGKAALLAKMHHTITDGVGGLRLSSSFLDFDADGDSPVRMPRVPTAARSAEGLSAGGGADDGEGRRRPWSTLDLGRIVRLARPDNAVRQARDGAETLVSVARQTVGQMGGPGSAAFGSAERSMGRRLETLDLNLDDARRTAKALGGTVNDFFVTGVTGGAAAYQRSLGMDVERYRVAMPVSTRVDSSFGGNSFAPARVSVPVTEKDPVARFQAAHSALNAARSERALGVVDSIAAVILALPPVVLAPLARQQVQSVDLAASNLRGSPVELYMAGARVEANYPMGPTAGVAFNATVLSYMDRLDLGLVTDAAAIEDPGGLRARIEEEFSVLVDAGRAGAR